MLNPETLAAFSYRDFRVLWTATLVRSAALAQELVARAVLIVELTGSAVLLGAILAAWMAPDLLLSPFAGAIVDRYTYRRVLIGSLLANATAAGVLFILLITGQAQSWQVIAVSALSGIGFVFFSLARRAAAPSSGSRWRRTSPWSRSACSSPPPASTTWPRWPTSPSSLTPLRRCAERRSRS